MSPGSIHQVDSGVSHLHADVIDSVRDASGLGLAALSKSNADAVSASQSGSINATDNILLQLI